MRPFIGMPVHFFELGKPRQPNAATIINLEGDTAKLVVMVHDAKPLLGVNDIGYAVQLRDKVPLYAWREPDPEAPAPKRGKEPPPVPACWWSPMELPQEPTIEKPKT